MEGGREGSSVCASFYALDFFSGTNQDNVMCLERTPGVIISKHTGGGERGV